MFRSLHSVVMRDVGSNISGIPGAPSARGEHNHIVIFEVVSVFSGRPASRVLDRIR